MFKSDEIKTVLETLTKVEQELSSPAFHIISDKIRRATKAVPEPIINNVRKAESIEQVVYVMIANVAGDELESGEHHLYRGVLNPIGQGDELLRIFKSSLDKLVKLGYISEEIATENINGIQENIKNVG